MGTISQSFFDAIRANFYLQYIYNRKRKKKENKKTQNCRKLVV